MIKVIMPAVKGLFGETVTEFNRAAKKSDGHAAPVATGPFGMMCGTCKHIVRICNGGKSFYKCRLMERFWTHGYGTDIRRKDWACRFWEKPDCVSRDALRKVDNYRDFVGAAPNFLQGEKPEDVIRRARGQ